MATPGRLGARQRTAVALVLQLAAALVLALALAGLGGFGAGQRPRGVVLVDRSSSMPRELADQALGGLLAHGGIDWRVLEFGRRPAVGGDAPDPSATDIEAALLVALALHAEQPLAGVVLISDGHANLGDTERALQALKAAQLPLAWYAVGREAPATRIAGVQAPQDARLGQAVPVTVALASAAARRLRVEAAARSPDGSRQAAVGEVEAPGRVALEFEAGVAGPLRVDLALIDATSGERLESLQDAAVVDVRPRAALLVAEGGAGLFGRSLARGGWRVESVSATRLDAFAAGLAGYQAVVLDDVAVADAGTPFWTALAQAVRERGTGLLVLGGERSFARGGYRGSVLESLLPLLSEPAALDEPVNLLFAVDKSGSMGRASGGVDRFALARRAVQETARGLDARDSLGLLVFDVEPRLLLPLGPAASGQAALAREWAARPNGGTRLAPAIEASIDELARARAGRRLLVVVTDGFVDEPPPPGLRERLERARIESVWLAVGPEADVAALQRIVGPGTVLRVNEAAELPAVMRSGVERQRARVERGPIAVEQVQPMPFTPARFEAWPPVDAHAVTRPRPEAVVGLQSRRGEALVAWQGVGRGRVAALACGLGPWTSRWLSWREWPRLAGGWADWVAGEAIAPALELTERDGALQVEADLPADAGLRLSVTTPAGQTLTPATEQVGPRRLRATLADAGPGLYAFEFAGARGATRQLLLRRPRQETAAWGTNPAIETWRRQGLLDAAREGAPAALPPQGARRPPVDRMLVVLALGLFLAGMLIDRIGLQPALPWRRR